MNYVESLNLFGVEAKEIPCIKGKGAPITATEGAVGCLYMDTNTGKLYKLTANAWVLEDADEAIAQEKAERQAEIAVERARINQFVALPNGSTTGDAELADARVGYDGSTYATAGEAVRGQVRYLADEVEEILDNMVGVTATTSEYLSRRTADGADVNDGSSTTLKVLRGNTVASDGMLTDAVVSGILSVGRNRLLPHSISKTVNGVTFTRNADQSITVKGTATAKTYHNIINFTYKNMPAGQYTFLGNPEPVDITIGAYKNNGSTWVKDLMTGRGNFTVDWVGYDTLKFNLYIFTGNTADCTFLPMLRFASVNGEVEPYMENKYVLPNEVTLSKFDYIDLARKKVVRQSKTTVHIGDENWVMSGTVAANNWRFGMSGGVPGIAETTTAILSHYKVVDTIPDGIAEGSGAKLWDNGYLEIVDTRFTTAADFKAHVAALANAGTPLTVKYQVNTVTEEDIDVSADTYTVYKDGFEVIEGNGIPCTVEQRYSTRIETQTPKRTPIVTFIDDDGAYDALQNWETIGDATGITNTFALVTGSKYLDWDLVERMQNKGYEFICHTHNHIPLNSTSEEDIVADFKQSQALLKAHGCNTSYLVYPNNACSAEKMEIVKKYFRGALWGGDEKVSLINVPPINPYGLTRYSVVTADRITKVINGQEVEVAALRPLDDFKRLIDEAVENGGWLIFMSHFYTYNSGGGYHFDEDVRNHIIEVCKYATKKGVRIETLGKAYEMYKNRLMADDCVVDCDGNVYNA